MRDAWDHLKDTHFKYLPHALDLLKDADSQVAEIDSFPYTDTDPCRIVSGLCLMAQDRYILELEQR